VKLRQVLVVSHVFPPMAAGGAPRMAQFCKYLPEFGWQPTVLTTVVPAVSAFDEAALRSLPDMVRVIRCRTPLARVAPRGVPNPRGGVRRRLKRVARFFLRLVVFPERQILWVPSATRVGSAALEASEFDAIFASFPPAASAVVGSGLARRSGLPLVLDFRDLWADQPLADFPTPIHRYIDTRLERRSAAAASALVAVSPAMAEHLARRHSRRDEDVVSIPNGFDPDDLARVRFVARSGDGPFRICYTGSVHDAYDFTTLFAAVRELAADGVITPQSLRFEFVGNLAGGEAGRAGVGEFVEVSGFVPHDGVVDVLNRSDAHLVIEDPVYWGRFSYPAKVFEYLVTGKPVLALVDSEGNTGRLLREAGVGVIADPADRTAVRAAILSLLARRGDPPRAVDITQPPLNALNRRLLTGRLAALLDRVSEESRRARGGGG
jgi:glycosyltransferase involved in cell wall biosynthesis